MVLNSEEGIWEPKTPPRAWYELHYFDSFVQEVKAAGMEEAIKKLTFGRKQACPQKRLRE